MTRARDLANVTVTPTFLDGSINIADLNIDAGTDINAALVDADLMIVDDGAGGTNRKATMSRLATYMSGKITGGSMVYLASSGAISDAATVVFTQFDSSKYDHYEFWFQDVIPATDTVHAIFQVSTDGGSNYDTTSGNYHYNLTTDLNGLNVAHSVGSDTNENGISGPFNLMNPHTTTYTRSVSNVVSMHENTTSIAVSSVNYAAGVHLVAEDTDAIRFLFSSGNVESGEIVMYGIANGS